MKKHSITFIAGILIGAVLFGGIAAVASTINIIPSTWSFFVDGQPDNSIEAYSIEGSNFLKLRDVFRIADVGVWYDADLREVYIERDKGYDADYMGPSQTEPSTPAPPPQDDGYIYALSDDEIREAIAEGARGMARAMEIDRSYIVRASADGTLAQTVANNCELRVYTPYLFIVRASAMAAARYETYSFEEAKEHNRLAVTVEQIDFEMRLAEYSYESTASMSIAAFQGNTRIDLTVTSGMNGFPERSSSWPNNPAYVRTVIANIHQSDIDVNEPVQIKVNYLGSWELVFTISLTNYK